jgi:hypothetical protein
MICEFFNESRGPVVCSKQPRCLRVRETRGHCDAIWNARLQVTSCVTTSMVYHAAARGPAIGQVESRLRVIWSCAGFLDLPPS